MRLYGAVSKYPLLMWLLLSGGLRDMIAWTARWATCSALDGDERAQDERLDMAWAIPAVPSFPIALCRLGRGTNRRIVLRRWRMWDERDKR